MSRLMSVALTEEAVRERRKTVTRRINWWENRNGRRLLNVGDELTLVRKSMGRKPGEPIVVVAQVEVVDMRREPLNAITAHEVRLEGFLHGEPHTFADQLWFMDFFCKSHAGCTPETEVTRIEWRYLDAQVPA